MVSKTVSSLGYDLVVQVPSTIEEYDTAAKKAGAALESAINNVLYRSTFAEFRGTFSDAIENNTGIERKTEVVNGKDGQPKKDSDGEVVTRFTETEKVYFDRVCATLAADGKFDSPEAAAASFKDLAQSIIGGIAFDPSETERVFTGPKKIAKAYIAVAQKAHDTGKLVHLATQLQHKLGETWKVEHTVDSVARAIAEDQRRKREAQKLDTEYGV